MGRCYLPGDELAAQGLRPEDLLEPGSHARFRLIFNRWLDNARDHLGAGWVYANTLPRSAVRLRLACAWPLLIGARTLALLRATSPLEAASPVKITRSELRGLLAKSLLLYPFKGAWERQFQQAARD
jgi:farnesyl-diphosphate farnesyltransferase